MRNMTISLESITENKTIHADKHAWAKWDSTIKCGPEIRNGYAEPVSDSYNTDCQPRNWGFQRHSPCRRNYRMRHNQLSIDYKGLELQMIHSHRSNERCQRKLHPGKAPFVHSDSQPHNLEHLPGRTEQKDWRCYIDPPCWHLWGTWASVQPHQNPDCQDRAADQIPKKPDRRSAHLLKRKRLLKRTKRHVEKTENNWRSWVFSIIRLCFQKTTQLWLLGDSCNALVHSHVSLHQEIRIHC